MAVCAITGTIKDFAGSTLAQKEISFVLKTFKAVGDDIFAQEYDPQVGAMKRIRTDSSGGFTVDLPREAEISIEIKEAGILGWFTVPDSVTATLTSILNDDDNFHNQYTDLNA